MERTKDNQLRLSKLIEQCHVCSGLYSDLQRRRFSLLKQNDALREQRRARRSLLHDKKLTGTERRQLLAQHPTEDHIEHLQNELMEAWAKADREMAQFLSDNAVVWTAVAILEQLTADTPIESLFPEEIGLEDVIVGIYTARLDLYYGGDNNDPLGAKHGHIIVDDCGRIVYHRPPGV